MYISSNSLLFWKNIRNGKPLLWTSSRIIRTFYWQTQQGTTVTLNAQYITGIWSQVEPRVKHMVTPDLEAQRVFNGFYSIEDDAYKLKKNRKPLSLGYV
jgi:hypothetical protein